MPNYTISVADEVSAHIEQVATEFGIRAPDLLAKAITLRANEFRSDLNPQWMPRERWDALVRGDNCPLCAEIASSETSDEYGTTIADLPMSRLRLNRNQGGGGLLCTRQPEARTRTVRLERYRPRAVRR